MSVVLSVKPSMEAADAVSCARTLDLQLQWGWRAGKICIAQIRGKLESHQKVHLRNPSEASLYINMRG